MRRRGPRSNRQNSRAPLPNPRRPCFSPDSGAECSAGRYAPHVTSQILLWFSPGNEKIPMDAREESVRPRPLSRNTTAIQRDILLPVRNEYFRTSSAPGRERVNRVSAKRLRLFPESAQVHMLSRLQNLRKVPG